MKKLMKNTWFQTIMIVLGLFLITIMGKAFVGYVGVVKGTSMTPTLKDGQFYFCNKLKYTLETPERYDIVSCYYNDDNNSSDMQRKFMTGTEKVYVKRVIGLPGERVTIDEDGCFYINGEKLEDDPMYGVNDTLGTYTDVLLGEDEYYVVGDNRNDSWDSRGVGPVSRDCIIGEVKVKGNK